MPQVNIQTPDGKTLNVPFTGVPPSAADIQAIIGDYEKQSVHAAAPTGTLGAVPSPGGGTYNPDSDSQNPTPLPHSFYQTSGVKSSDGSGPWDNNNTYDPKQHGVAENALVDVGGMVGSLGHAIASKEGLQDAGTGFKMAGQALADIGHDVITNKGPDAPTDSPEDKARQAREDDFTKRIVNLIQTSAGGWESPLFPLAQAQHAVSQGNPTDALNIITQAAPETAQFVHDHPGVAASIVAPMLMKIPEMAGKGFGSAATGAAAVAESDRLAAIEAAKAGDVDLNAYHANNAEINRSLAQGLANVSGKPLVEPQSVAARVGQTVYNGVTSSPVPVNYTPSPEGLAAAKRQAERTGKPVADFVQQAAHSPIDEATQIPQGRPGEPQAPPLVPSKATGSVIDQWLAAAHEEPPTQAPHPATATEPTIAQSKEAPPPGAHWDVDNPFTEEADAAGTIPPSNTPSGRVIENFPTSQLNVDPGRFQYKMLAGEGGQTGSLTDAKVYNPDIAGLTHVWLDPADGQTYVVNGHNRYSLANRTGYPSMAVRYMDAPDAATARTTGALINIAEGQGTAVDAAKLFREQGYTPEDLQQYGVNLKGRIAKDGMALANLHPTLFNSVARGEFPIERAAIIGEKLPKPEDQLALVNLIDKMQRSGRSLTNGQVSEMAENVASGPKATITSGSLFGDNETVQNLAVERATVADYIRTQLSGEGKAFDSASKNAGRLAKGENVINAQRSAEIAAENRTGKDLFDRFKNKSGKVSDILNRAAGRIANGEKATDVKQSALREYQAAIPELSRGQVSESQALGSGHSGVTDRGNGQIEGAAGSRVPNQEGLFHRFINEETGSAYNYGGAAANAVAAHLEDINHLTHNGRYRASYAFDKDVGDAMNTAAASREIALSHAELNDRYVHASLTLDQRNLLGRYYADQRAQAFENAGNTTHNVPKLSPSERTQVANDPKIQAAIQKYESGVAPYLLKSRQYVSPQMQQTTTPSGHFASIIAKEDPTATGRVAGGSLANSQRMRGTRFAQEAEGNSKTGWETDLGKNMRTTLPEVVPKANQKALYEKILATKDADGNPLAYTNANGKKLPDTIKYNGVEHPVSKPFEIATRATPDGHLIKLEMVVPHGIEADLDDVTTHINEQRSVFNYLKGFANTATAISLSSPAEVIYHANRVLSLAKAIPGMGVGRVGVLKKLINLDMSHPDNVAALQRLMEANGGSSRPFADNLHGNILTRIPLAGKLIGKAQEFNHGTLFGLPEHGGIAQLKSGSFGLDLRLRVAAENLRAKMEGNVDPQRVREFANQFGQYTSKCDKAIEQAKGIHPFAATSLPMRITETRQLLGGTGLKGLTPAKATKVRLSSIASGVGGTLMAYAALNYAATGHWPWENDKGHEFDLQIGNDDDGKPVYIDGNKVMPTIMRPLKAAGLTDTASDIIHPGGTTPIEHQIAGNTIRGMANSAMAEANSPMVGAALTAVSGKAPYLTKGRTLLQVAPKAGPGESQDLEDIKAAFANLNPIGRVTGQQKSFNGEIQNPAFKLLDVLGVLKKDKTNRTH